MNSPTAARAFQGLRSFTQQHRTGVIAGAVALLAGFGITAVAVAPLAPDAALLPQRLVTEAVVPEGLDAQLLALSAQHIELSRNDLTRATDTPERLLARLGVNDAEAARFLRSDADARRLLSGRGGKMVRVRSDGNGRLQQLVARFPVADDAERAKTHFTRLTLERVQGQWRARLEQAAYGTEQRMGSGTIRSSLFGATDEAGLPDSVAAQLAEIFSTEIDFHRELRRGDSFSVVYESLTADGEPVAWIDSGAGRVLAAEFVNAGQTHQAVWFAPSDGRGTYYDVDGNSKKRAFLASPLEFSRVTSGFAMRLHPLLQSWRRHLGVDYGAPSGTAVRSVGDGVVSFAGRQNGYGNVVEIQHSANRTTLYAHLSRIDVRAGQRIEQGQNLGAVGATGWATGPHLHFEFRVAGAHQDPLSVAKGTETMPLDAASRARFNAWVNTVKARLDVAETLAAARPRTRNE